MDGSMRIGLLGQFGSGNSGNDGSLEAMLAFLRRALPDAGLLCICSNPVKIGERFALDTISIRGGASFARPLLRFIDAKLGRLPGRIASLIAIVRALHGVDVMVIPGTGILDDFQERPFGWPFIVYWWCLAARLHGTRVAFVSIGAGPIRGSLSRWFLKSAIAMAEYRSYRDDYSLHYVRGLGIDTASDPRFPDIAFGLEEPIRVAEAERRKPATVGIGVMRYRGWERGHANADVIYRTYVNKIATLSHRLATEGHHVRFFIGDTSDELALTDVRKILAAAPASTNAERYSAARTVSLHEVMNEILQVDIAIVSRYHNLLCALKLDRPALSLGYAEKNDELMTEFGRSMYCQHIETFDVDHVMGQVRQVLADLEAARERIALRNASIRTELARQQDLLLSRVLVDRRAPALPLAQDALR
jgi:polysaccharide pyruvyl transferase WcaK-like protein